MEFSLNKLRQLDAVDSHILVGDGTKANPFKGHPGSDMVDFAAEVFAKWGGDIGNGKDAVYLLGGGNKYLFALTQGDDGRYLIDFEGDRKGTNNFSAEETKAIVSDAGLLTMGVTSVKNSLDKV